MWSLADASPTRLRELAKEFASSSRWASFLTPHEHQFFEAALNGKEQTWALFIEGRIPCQLRIASADDATPATIDVDPVALAFRVRYMLWDTQLERLGDADLATTLHNASPDISGDGKPPLIEQSSNFSRKIDDEYDDDDDEDDEDDVGSESRNGSADVPPVLIVDAKEEDSEPDPRGRLLTVQNCSKMYHTFESDHETMQRYLQLQASDEQIEVPGEDAGDPTRSDRATSETSRLSALAKTAQFGSASLSLKHLLSTIESKWSEMHVTDIELRNLISDVRKNRSKWASEDRIGQEELYEACDKVVQELRNTTEHSTAFLNKVNKRDAPNYYQIIKNPMDLNTVSRKLRVLQYNSKEEFVNDLNLIWQNCLTYNSDPRHFLRAHAIAMRKKTATLSPLIPDITVRDRAEVEAEAEEQERLRGLNPDSNKRKADGAEGGKGQKRKLAMAPAGTTSNGETVDDGEAEEEATQGVRMSRNDTPAVGSASPPQSAPASPSGSRLRDTPASESNTENGNPTKDAAKDGKQDSALQGTTKDGETGNESVVDNPIISVKEEGAAGQPNDQPVLDVSNSEATIGIDGSRGDKAQGQLGAASETPGVDQHEEVDLSGARDKNTEEERSLPPIEEDFYAPDVESVVWNTATKRRRLECISNRNALFADDKLQMDAPIELRRPGLMARFDNAIKSEDPIGQNAGISLLSVDPGEEPFLVEYEVNAGIPSQPPEDQSPWLTAPLPHPSELQPTRYIANGTVSELVNRNLNEMQMIRRLCSKILFIRDLQNGQVSQIPDPAAAQSNATGHGLQEYPDVHDPEPDISSRLPGAMPLDSKASYAAMSRTAAKIAMHAGFEAAQPAAIDILAEIAGDHLFKLGQTLVAQLEAPDSSASFSSILKGTLSEMGIPKLDLLSRYIADDILKQGRRLSTFRSRLNTTLVEILRPEVDRYNDEQFNDNSDQFVMGQFSNELGDDYFGFKELGLDQELGVANIAIPFHLLRQRLVADQSAGIARPGSNIDVMGLEVPEYPPLTALVVAKLPSFLREGITKLLPKSVRTSVAAASAETAESINEITQADKEDRVKSYEAQDQLLTKMASQALSMRSKIPASGKLVARKKNINKAFKRKKTVKVEPPSADLEDTGVSNTDADGASVPTAPEQQPELGLDHSVPTPGDQQPDTEILPFSIDDAPVDNGFNLEDNLNTGSLMLDAGDEGENDGDADGGDADGASNDVGEIDDLDMSMPSLDFNI